MKRVPSFRLLALGVLNATGWLFIATASAEPIAVHSVIIKLIDQVDVPAREAGALESIVVREGDRLEQGQVIARLEADEAKLAAEQIELEIAVARIKAEDESGLRAAEEELKFAQAELLRAKETIAKFPNAISASEFERMRLDEARAKYKVEQWNAELKIARVDLERKKKEAEFAQLQLRRRQLTSPLDGVVVQTYRRSGEWVEAGEKVARVIRLDQLRAEGFVDLRDAKQDLRDAAATLSVVLPGGSRSTYRGKLVFVSPEIDPVNGQFRVWAEIENRDGRLRPGIVADMTLTTN